MSDHGCILREYPNGQPYLEQYKIDVLLFDIMSDELNAMVKHGKK